MRRLRESMMGRSLVIGVDRLDYSKGINDRFIAFGRFLDRHAEHRTPDRVLQVAPTSRGEVPEYRRSGLSSNDSLVGQRPVQ